jgi:hypothetical protein
MTPHRHAALTFALALLVILSLAPAASAQIAVSANDNKVLNVHGGVKVVPNPPPGHRLGHRPQGLPAPRDC